MDKEKDVYELNVHKLISQICKSEPIYDAEWLKAELKKLPNEKSVTHPEDWANFKGNK